MLPRVAPVFDGIPETLRERRQWVLWRLEHKPGARKPTKVPCRSDGRPASSTAPATWCAFEEARAAYETGRFGGVGYVFSSDDPFVGIDLDSCRDAETGELAPWAKATINRFATYTEVSPSGTGVHLILEGALPQGGRKRGQIECYDTGRYFTITGRSLDGTTPGSVQARWDELEAWHAEVFGASVPESTQETPESGPEERREGGDRDDDALLERARRARNGEKFRALFDRGETTAYPSQSEADLALCMLLAFWTSRESVRIDRLFRRSALFREKWDQGAGQGETYGQRTVRTAVARCVPDAGSAELCTDLGNARRLVRLHGKDLRYTGALGWLVWDGRRWRRDDTGAVERHAKQAIRGIWNEARAAKTKEAQEALAAWAVKSQQRARIEAAVALCRTEPEVAARAEDFDRDPWLLNVSNGTLDLRTSDLRAHRREDLLTKLVPVAYEAAAKAPRWQRFLEQVQPDPEVRGFLSRYAGYSLTGEMGEQVFAVHHGGGGNGKGVYSDTLLAVLGDYATVTPYATFVQRRPEAPTNDLAALRGARLVIASEPNEGVRLDEGAVKTITGEDPVTARFHYQEFFTYRPACKLVLTGNHRPRIRGTDYAMWRRVLLVPWPVTVANPDKDLRRHLRDELPGILRWAVEGCLAWQREGLRPPGVVRAAVEEYREAEDHVGRFIGDRCRLGSDLVVSSKDLRSAYQAWAEEEGEDALSGKAFGARLTDRGIRGIRNTHGIRGRGWLGIAVGTLGTDGRFGGKGPPHARTREDFSADGVHASHASQPDPDDLFDAAEREATREEGNASDPRERGSW